MSISALGWIRVAGLVEALSFLVLLFIAMPLKYAAGMPEPVRYVGWAHGVFFMAFAATTFLAWGLGHISARLVGLAAIASVVPFGPFFISRELNFFSRGHRHPKVTKADPNASPSPSGSAARGDIM